MGSSHSTLGTTVAGTVPDKIGSACAARERPATSRTVGDASHIALDRRAGALRKLGAWSGPATYRLR